jgi:hypothetical protein
MVEVRVRVAGLVVALLLGCSGALPRPGRDSACLPLAGARREGLAAFGDRLVWTEAHAREDGTTRWDLWTTTGEGAALLAADVGWDARPLPGGGFGGTRASHPAGRYGWVAVADGAATQRSPAAHDVLAWAVSPAGRLWWLAAAGAGDPVAWVLEDDGTSTPTWTATRLWGATEDGAVVRGVSGGTWLLPRDGAAPRFLGADADEVALHAGHLVRVSGGSVERADAVNGAAIGAPLPGSWVPGGWVRTVDDEGWTLRAADARGDALQGSGGLPTAVVASEALGRWALVTHDTDHDGRIGPSDESDVCRLVDGAAFRDRNVPLRFVGRGAALASAIPAGGSVRFVREGRAVELTLPHALPATSEAAFDEVEGRAEALGTALGRDDVDVTVVWLDGRAQRRFAEASGEAWTELDAFGVQHRDGEGLDAAMDARLEIDRGRGRAARVRWNGAVVALDRALPSVAVEVGAWSLLGEDPVVRRVDLGDLQPGAPTRWSASLTVDMARHPDLRVAVWADGRPVPWRDEAAEREARDWWRTVQEARAVGFVHDWHKDGVRIPGRLDHDLAAFLAPPGFSRLPQERVADLALKLGALLDRHYADAHRSGWLGAEIIDGEARIPIDRDGLARPTPARTGR